VRWPSGLFGSGSADGVVVLEDLYGSVEFRSHLAEVYIKRALESVAA
jgi:CO/xanthine dehydrogenase FAD-binding subunit